jgi:hypothetical protein
MPNTLRPYDRQKAVDYARKWAMSRNPRYYDFENIGGDCTNFSSQCLFAGSGLMNPTPVFGWYYFSLENRSASWSGVEYLFDFITKNKSVGPFGHVCSEDELEPGDFVQLGAGDGHFYHSPFIVAVSPQIEVCAHTYDSLDRALSTYEYAHIRHIHIDGVRTA